MSWMYKNYSNPLVCTNTTDCLNKSLIAHNLVHQSFDRNYQLFTKWLGVLSLYLGGASFCGCVVRVNDLQSLAPHCCGFNPTGTLDFFMRGSCPATLQSDDGFTWVPYCA